MVGELLLRSHILTRVTPVMVACSLDAHVLDDEKHFTHRLSARVTLPQLLLAQYHTQTSSGKAKVDTCTGMLSLYWFSPLKID